MTFIFKEYGYDAEVRLARFEYAYDDGRTFIETLQFSQVASSYDEGALERALFLAFLLVGVSYYKAFPAKDIMFVKGGIDAWQVDFLGKVYQEGLSQFAFENHLTRDDLAHFSATTHTSCEPAKYGGKGIVALQSGGKDSLLVAQLLASKDLEYTPWYISSGSTYPALLDELSQPMVIARRQIDRDGLLRALADGGMNGHVPVTYIVLSYALVQAVLLNKNTVLAGIAHEGDEPHEWIDDLPVNHQWSKAWQAEQLFAEYVAKYISPSIKVGSPLRGLSELKVAELFVRHAWDTFGDSFSSCNVANYQQGADNTQLAWCGNCPKCANSYLLFAPFLAKEVLDERIGGDLFVKPELIETFKGLLGIDGIMKPFECVGEVDELRAAYHEALANGYSHLPFDVPLSTFDKDTRYAAQHWAEEIASGNS